MNVRFGYGSYLTRYEMEEAMRDQLRKYSSDSYYNYGNDAILAKIQPGQFKQIEDRFTRLENQVEQMAQAVQQIAGHYGKL